MQPLQKIKDALKIEEGGAIINSPSEKEQIIEEFKSLIAYGKPANFTLYLYSDTERLLSLTINVEDNSTEASFNSIYESFACIAIFLTMIHSPRFIFIYDTLLPYMGNVDSKAIVVGKYIPYMDLEVEQHPYSVVNNEVIFLEELVPNPSVSPINDELLTCLKTIRSGQITSKITILPLVAEFLESKSIDICTYGNHNIGSIVDSLMTIRTQAHLEEITENGNEENYPDN